MFPSGMFGHHDSMYRKRDFMIGLKINDIKNFMTKLLLKKEFDSFLLEQAELVTASKMTLSGRRNQKWYDTETWKLMEQEALEDVCWMSWKEIRTVVFSYIKGNQTPEIMRISFRASHKMAEELLADSGVLKLYYQYHPDLFLQLRYEQGVLTLITGIAFSEFLLDKTIEKAWDDAVMWFFKSIQIPFEMME